MKLLQAVLVGTGPFEKLVLPFADEAGEARAMTVIHGAGGVGKSSVLAALASTRPGHCVVQPTRWEPAESAPQPFAACDWALGQDEPLRPHPLSIVSPNARLSVSDEQEALRRREQALFDRLAAEGGFAFLTIPSTRWFSRQPIAFSAPARTVARYDVRAAAATDDATRSDLARETKQALAYAAISSALSLHTALPPRGERSFDLLGASMQSALDTLLARVGRGDRDRRRRPTSGFSGPAAAASRTSRGIARGAVDFDHRVLGFGELRGRSCRAGAPVAAGGQGPPICRRSGAHALAPSKFSSPHKRARGRSGACD